MPNDDLLNLDDDTLDAFTSHERSAREKVLEWRDAGDGPLRPSLRAVQNKAGSALQWATPTVAQDTVRDAIEGGFEMVQVVVDPPIRVVDAEVGAAALAAKGLFELVRRAVDNHAHLHFGRASAVGHDLADLLRF
ncbi:hypothetical protein GGP84_003035 [Salinibacter ruber]|nr:hypothetical protein [Salinibacter ruber]MCS3940383.1 hypothetical protein [Salinibacter ruber]